MTPHVSLTLDGSEDVRVETFDASFGSLAGSSYIRISDADGNSLMLRGVDTECFGVAQALAAKLADAADQLEAKLAARQPAPVEPHPILPGPVLPVASGPLPAEFATREGEPMLADPDEGVF